MNKRISTPKAIAMAVGGGQRSGETTSDASRRGWGRMGKVAGSLALVGALFGAGHTMIERASATAVPGHETEYDTNKYHQERIPENITVSEFINERDPAHDWRNGYEELKQQLGHEPEQGDMVWVPNQQEESQAK